MAYDDEQYRPCQLCHCGKRLRDLRFWSPSGSFPPPDEPGKPRLLPDLFPAAGGLYGFGHVMPDCRYGAPVTGHAVYQLPVLFPVTSGDHAVSSSLRREKLEAQHAVCAGHRLVDDVFCAVSRHTVYHLDLLLHSRQRVPQRALVSVAADPSGPADDFRHDRALSPPCRPHTAAADRFSHLFCGASDLYAGPDVLLRSAADRIGHIGGCSLYVRLSCGRSGGAVLPAATGNRQSACPHHGTADAAALYLQHPDEHLRSLQSGPAKGKAGHDGFHQLPAKELQRRCQREPHSLFRGAGAHPRLSGRGTGAV